MATFDCRFSFNSIIPSVVMSRALALFVKFDCSGCFSSMLLLLFIPFFYSLFYLIFSFCVVPFLVAFIRSFLSLTSFVYGFFSSLLLFLVFFFFCSFLDVCFAVVFLFNNFVFFFDYFDGSSRLLLCGGGFAVLFLLCLLCFSASASICFVLFPRRCHVVEMAVLCFLVNNSTIE